MLLCAVVADDAVRPDDEGGSEIGGGVDKAVEGVVRTATEAVKRLIRQAKPLNNTSKLNATLVDRGSKILQAIVPKLNETVKAAGENEEEGLITPDPVVCCFLF